jgi:hypothetical protein
MTAHKAAGNLEVLFPGGLAKLDYPLGTCRVGRERFFHEDIDALFDSILDVCGTKGRVSRLDHNVARAEAVDGLSIGVEAEETLVRRYVDLFRELFGECIM